MMTIAAYAVPIFLLINGYLVIHKEYSMKDYLRKVLRTILVTFTWGMLYNLVFGIVFQEEKSVIDVIRIVYQGGIYQGEYISIRNWFFWALAIIYIFLPFVSVVFKSENKRMSQYLFWLVFVFTIGNDLISRVLTVISLCSDVNLMEFANIFPKVNIFSSWDSFALAYFIAGGMIYQYKAEIMDKLRKIKLVPCILVMSAILMLYGLWYMTKTEGYYNIVWSGYPSITLFVGAVMIFCGMIDRKIRIPNRLLNVIVKISKDSMGIYFMHLLIGTLLKPFYLSMDGSERLLMGVLFSLVVFLLSVVACEVIERIPILNNLVKL